MQRLPALHARTAKVRAKELLEQAEAGWNFTPNMMRTMANSAAVLRSYLVFEEAMSHGVLGAQLRERIALVVAEANQCLYCASVHATIGRVVGLDEAEIVASRDADSSEPRIAAALEFARNVLEYRGDLTDAEFEIVRRAGYTDEEITEIVGIVVLNIFTNYFNLVAQTEVDHPA